jgi:Na+/proline symporter
VKISTQNLKRKAYHETKKFILIALYLWIVFALFSMYKSVVLSQHSIDFKSFGLALINALALAKVILVARALRLGNQADDAPLIYPTLLKSALFSVVLACFKIIEEVVIGLYHRESFQQSIAGLGGGTLTGILTLTTILFVTLIPFFGFSELQRVLGESKLRQIFLGRREGVWESREKPES